MKNKAAYIVINTDDKFIELAIDAGAKILISGGPDLKNVQTYQGVEILSPAQFFERFKPQ